MVWGAAGPWAPRLGVFGERQRGHRALYEQRHACARRRARRAFDGGGLPSDALIERAAGLAASFGHPI